MGLGGVGEASRQPGYLKFGSARRADSRPQRVASLREVVPTASDWAHQTLARRHRRAYLGPGDRVGDLRVPGGSAGQVHILGTSHLHLLCRGRQAAGYKERERGVSEREKGAPRGGGGRQAIWGPTAAEEQELEAARHGWGCGPVARSRRAALLYPRAGTSPGAGPGDSPRAAEAGAGPCPPASRRRGAPVPAPACASPPPAALRRLPGRGDNHPRGTPRAGGFANSAGMWDSVPLAPETKPGAGPAQAVRPLLWRRNQIQRGWAASPVAQPVRGDVTGEPRSSLSSRVCDNQNSLDFQRNGASLE